MAVALVGRLQCENYLVLNYIVLALTLGPQITRFGNILCKFEEAW